MEGPHSIRNMPKYTSNPDILDAIAPMKYMVDIPDIEAGWLYNMLQAVPQTMDTGI
jgi:hypothetical protein